MTTDRQNTTDDYSVKCDDDQPDIEHLVRKIVECPDDAIADIARDSDVLHALDNLKSIGRKRIQAATLLAETCMAEVQKLRRRAEEAEAKAERAVSGRLADVKDERIADLEARVKQLEDAAAEDAAEFRESVDFARTPRWRPNMPSHEYAHMTTARFNYGYQCGVAVGRDIEKQHARPIIARLTAAAKGQKS